MGNQNVLVKAMRDAKQSICFTADVGHKMILAGDIGGTHTRLALFEKGKMVVERKYPSQNYSSLETIILEFLQSEKASPTKACFGIAGAVYHGKCKATNLPWTLETHAISIATQIPSVRLLNDLEANAFGLRKLKKEELFCLQKGKPQEGNQALIAAGTGLGEAGLFWNGSDHLPFASEGGHSDFAPRDPQECELLLFLQNKFPHVSYERIVSGKGLHLLYQFLIEIKKEKPSPLIQAEMEKKNPSIVISEWGIQKKDTLCAKALEWFISLYGAEAGNVALKFLSLGGLFIGGGIAPKLLGAMKEGTFMESFTQKGRFQPLLESIPVWVILNDDAALLGSAYCAEFGQNI